jgi:glycosyltransferase involved in cell wall biosynthesis
MAPHRGFNILLRALAAAVEASPVAEMHLVLIGEGPEREAWEELAQELGHARRVHWAGNISETERSVFLNMADALIVPSVRLPVGGQSLVLLEAMAAAKPVIASEAAASCLTVWDGLNGFLVPEGDAEALSRAMCALAADPALRARMGQSGRRLVETELGWPVLAGRYVEHFRRLSEQAQVVDAPEAPSLPHPEWPA